MPVKIGLKYIDMWKSSMENEVRAYEEKPAMKGGIVFYGPSHFTRWNEKFGNSNLEEDIVGKSGKVCAVNRGFGSSCAEHHLYFYSRMVRPLEPKVLVYYCQGNSEDFGYTPEEQWEIAQRVIVYALEDFPEAHVYICSCNPRPHPSATEDWLDRTDKVNAWSKEFAEKTDRCTYLDIYNHAPLQDKEVLEDHIHLNANGYKKYAEFFREALKDELEKF